MFLSSASLFSTPFKYPEKTGVTGDYPEHSYKSRNSHPPRRPHHKSASPSVGSQRRQLLPGHEHTIITYPPRWNRMGHVLWKEAWADSQVATISVSFRLCTCHCPVSYYPSTEAKPKIQLSGEERGFPAEAETA